MRVKLAKRVKTLFDQRMRILFPRFIELKNIPLPKNCILYCFNYNQLLCFYLFLLISPKHDEFTVEVAWSEKCTFPKTISRLNDPPINGELKFRVADDWRNPIDSKWWSFIHDDGKQVYTNILDYLNIEMTVEEALNYVAPFIDDVFNRLSEFVIPYFKSITIEHGFEPEIFKE